MNMSVTALTENGCGCGSPWAAATDLGDFNPDEPEIVQRYEPSSDALRIGVHPTVRGRLRLIRDGLTFDVMMV
ncbi:MAG: hypothetical protein EOP84_00805 [Verrucomicrobiaceae bacterium]|nr:MAG: hypothetical protein EOP84_00805 [Verrucomicrobiaceae bacterium]